MTKGKIFQIGILISLLGFFIYKLTPILGLSDLTKGSISNLTLIIIVLIWVSSYFFRVINGKMTFMEQRKRYRDKYEKVMNEKLIKEFDSMSEDDKNKLLNELEEN